MLAVREGVPAQGEVETAFASLESGRLEGALERGRVAAQQVERLAAIGHQACARPALAVHFQVNFDVAELRRLEAELEMVAAAAYARSDRDGYVGDPKTDRTEAELVLRPGRPRLTRV
jgi:hypothetical protein